MDIDRLILQIARDKLGLSNFEGQEKLAEALKEAFAAGSQTRTIVESTQPKAALLRSTDELDHTPHRGDE